MHQMAGQAPAWYRPGRAGRCCSEGAHAACFGARAGLIKVCLAYEHATLPANLHFREPNPNNAGLKDGILKVVTAPTDFAPGSIVALSNFGFGGARPRPLPSPLALTKTTK